MDAATIESAIPWGPLVISDVTVWALMLGAVGAAIGGVGVVLRLLFKSPKVVQDWLDQRAAARVRHTKQDAALDCLIQMQPELLLVIRQLKPNDGSSLYDIVHQSDAGLSELRYWVGEHRERHDEEAANRVDSLAQMHVSLEEMRMEQAKLRAG
jgi:hypothetical protein